MHKNPKGFDEAKCKTIDQAMFAKLDDYFPLGFKAIPNVKIVVQHFVQTPSQMCCRPS
jgi:hypothetical protein